MSIRLATGRRVDAIESQIAEDWRRPDTFRREMREMYWRALVGPEAGTKRHLATL